MLDGALKQRGGQQFARYLSTAGSDWKDYTFSVKAKKNGGREGFLIYFHVGDENNAVFWNLGGWGNTETCVQQTVDGVREEVSMRTPCVVDTGRWYDIRIEVKGRSARCFLDGKLTTEATIPAKTPKGSLYASASRDGAAGDVILKVVNLSDDPQAVKINLAGKTPVTQGTAEVLTGDPDAVNSVEEPTAIVPAKESLTGLGKTFERRFPANSVSVLRLKK